MKEVRVGLLGLGTIGTGVAKLMLEHEQLLSTRLNKPIRLVRACDLDITRDRGLDARLQLTTNVHDVIAADDIDVVIELVGGYEPAHTFVAKALANGKHVVTANKALIAKYGEELFAQADANGLTIGFEAAVGGGIPCMKALREGLAANKIESLCGILNGTCNFILTKMEREKLSFETALAQAQALGYAEADPTFDVGGMDTAHKLSILAALAFGSTIRFEDVWCEGITRITEDDMTSAAEFGFRIKLLGIARPNGDKVEMRVHPTLVPLTAQIAGVSDAFNAVMVRGDYVGDTLFYGRGAGERPTASAVVADVLDIARALPDGVRQLPPPMGLPQVARQQKETLPMQDVVSEYYLRLMVKDEPGVLARVTEILAHQRISLEAVQQKLRHATSFVPIVMLTHATREGNLQAAVSRIVQLDCVDDEPLILRIERFGG